MLLREQIQRAELRRHARSVAHLAATLTQAEDFPTPTARDFCTIIQKSAELIAAHVTDAPRHRLPYIHVILAELGEDLRFAERSRIEHTPWSLVQATESLLQAHVGKNYRFIIRPQWSYNYGIVGDLVAHYRTRFAALPDWLPIDKWEASIAEFAEQRIFSISFPRVEKMNVLTHAIWGHEVGHILASEWLISQFTAVWEDGEAAIKAAVSEYVTADPPEGLGTPSFLADAAVALFMEQTLTLARNSLKELISDAVGAHLFGPAALASMAEFSSRFDLDANPTECGGYPPWRYRLREVSTHVVPNLLAAVQPDWHVASTTFVEWLGEWHKLGADDADRVKIESDVRSRMAYQLIEKHWARIRHEVLARLPEELQAPYALHERQVVVGELIDRIKQWVPPNETGIWPDVTPASMADIWNAAWSCKVHEFRQNSGPDFDDYLEVLFQLTLKAVEASYVQTTFGGSIEKGATTP